MITVLDRKRHGEAWQGKHGTFFPFIVELSDGTSVMANSTSEDPWWSKGTPVIWNHNGSFTKSGLPKGGFDKPMEGVTTTSTSTPIEKAPRKAPRVNYGERELGMRIGMSINNACSLLSGTNLKGAEFERELEALARSIYSVAERMAGNPTGTLHDAKAATAEEEVPF